jgi:hypothetical protein
MVRLLTAAVLSVAALLLSGCYISDDLLLDSGSAQTPLSNGTYASAGDKVDISARSDGWYDVYTYFKDGSRSSSPDRLLLNRAADLETSSNYVYYFASEDETLGWIYGLIVVEGNAVYEVRPDCEHTNDADIGRGEGGYYDYDEDVGATCTFTDAGSLKRALGRYYRSTYPSDPYYRQ